MFLKPNDIRSSVVVFLVALPLCLGVALASNAPLSSGILAGIVGGIVLGLMGGSAVSVSGPAAGLTVIVAGAIAELGGFPQFATAVVISGVMQIAMGFLKAGELGNFFPSSVIKGMLAAIGLILIMKQLPHLVGWDKDYMGDMGFEQADGHNTITEIFYAFKGLHFGATIIGLLSIVIILGWDKILAKKFKKLSLIPSALIAVIASIALNETLFLSNPNFLIELDHLVRLPYTGGFSSFFASIALPDWSSFSNYATWKVAVTLAIVASLETLLSLDAADKIDPLKRTSFKNKELRGQGVGNLISGLLGGLPITAVIVRSSANVASGGLQRSSPLLHGVWLLLSVVLIPDLLSRIPLATLAAILLLVGWKLTSPALYKQQWNRGKAQFIPFVTTVVAILFTDLLIGIGIGLAVGLFFVLKANAQSSVIRTTLDDQVLIRFSKDVSFLQKNKVRDYLRALPDNSSVVIDGSRSIYIDDDIVEVVEDFMTSCESRNITVTLQKSSLALCKLFKE